MAKKVYRSRDGLTLAQCRARYARIAAALKRGATTGQVVERFGVKFSTVYAACRAHGLATGVHGQVGSYAARRRRREKMAEAVRAGASTARAARRFGVTPDTVRRACAEAGVKPSGPRRSAALDARRALAAKLPGSYWKGLHPTAAKVLRLLLRTSLTYQEIGDAAGVSRQRVGQVFEAAQGAA